MKDDDMIGGCVTGFLVGSVGAAISTWLLLSHAQERMAVQHKAAQWVTLEDGSAEFKWNDEINIEKKEK